MFKKTPLNKYVDNLPPDKTWKFLRTPKPVQYGVVIINKLLYTIIVLQSITLVVHLAYIFITSLR